MRYLVLAGALLLTLPMLYRSFMNKQHQFEQQLQQGFERCYREGYGDGKKDGFKAGLATCDDVLASIDAQGRY